MPARLLRRRPAVAIALAATAALTLTACEKESPQVTVTSGKSSAHGSTDCWVGKGEQLPASCQNTPAIGTVKVRTGTVIGISVDPKIADLGWIVQINGEALTQEPIEREYYAFDVRGEVPQRGATISIVARGGGAGAARGIWKFDLARD